ncbi:putative leucine-rich repeat domain, L domain-containing protein [Medicago truncatula]|uniref:F-box/LRR protein, putative n=1 Tax=Medicago truncatula TaxID=3880 RepID=A0A072UPD5_MEDTR|nr:F-box/LRR-repeat protein 3 [Medicago truncatula]KEH27715.1 F-box/LRR protein, putative [Medicago truncatula]RHN54846.1 putative leucine-rich repeat domain, L domain-containing protein [Medicago truncatula]
MADVSRKRLAADMYLPDECWESVFQFLNENNYGGQSYLEHLSLVSKQFLSITNRLRSSLTLRGLLFLDSFRLPFLARLLHRFPALTSLDLTQIHCDLNDLLSKISHFSLDLVSLNLSNGSSAIPDNGLQALNGNMKKTLTSLKCFDMVPSRNKDLLLTLNCFPFLQEVDLSSPRGILQVEVRKFVSALPNLRKINLSGTFMSDTSLLYLCKNCKFLEEIVIIRCCVITVFGVASAIRERPGLRCLSVSMLRSLKKFELQNPSALLSASLFSLKGLTYLDFSFSYTPDKLFFSLAEKGLPLRSLVLKDCFGYSYTGIFRLLSKCQLLQHLDLQLTEFLNDQHVAKLSLLLGDLISINVSFCKQLTETTLFELVKNCPLLADINMEETSIGKTGWENPNSSMDLVVSPRVKSLRLKGNAWLRDKSIQMFADFFPNLELLDLSSCYCVFVGVGEVLRRSDKIRHLSLASSFGAKLLEMNLEVPKLEVLNLSRSATDDEALYAISKSCCGLLQLDLENCNDVTEKGVRQVVAKCTKLREINLRDCQNVAGNVVSEMVLSRPSLRKITIPPFYHPSDHERELFLHHGCLVF